MVIRKTKLLYNAVLPLYQTLTLQSIAGITYSRRLLCATPGILLQDYKLQDKFGCTTRLFHHHRVTTVVQQIHSATRHQLRNDCSSRDIHHLDKYAKIVCLHLKQYFPKHLHVWLQIIKPIYLNRLCQMIELQNYLILFSPNHL